MSEVHWYIQDDYLPEWENLQRIIYIIQEMGMTAHVHPYIPFEGMDYPFLPTDKPVVALGGIGMAKDFQKRGFPHRPFVWFDQQKLRCCSYYSEYVNDIVSPDSWALINYESLDRLWDRWFDDHGSDDLLFIKPDTNDKAFAGEVVKRSNKAMWKGYVERCGEQDPKLPCIVSKPVRISDEWRLFVADGKVVTGSKYKENGMICKEEGYPKEAAELAERLFRVWTPHPIMCMDIGLTPDGYKLIEIGSANCAGFYMSDLRPIIESMAKIALREFNQ